jgi:hypothetical protein
MMSASWRNQVVGRPGSSSRLARAALVVRAQGSPLTALSLDELLDRGDGNSSGAADVHDLDLARSYELVHRRAPDRQHTRRLDHRQQQRFMLAPAPFLALLSRAPSFSHVHE